MAGRNIQQYKLIGDFEGVVTYGVGFMRIEPTATAIRSDPIDPRHSSCISTLDHRPAEGLTQTCDRQKNVSLLSLPARTAATCSS